MSTKTQQLYDLANDLYNYLDNSVNAEGLTEVYIEDDMNAGVIAIRIDGDWKHDHLRADWLARKYFDNNKDWKLLSSHEDEVGESDSDAGVSDHYYIVQLRQVTESTRRSTGKTPLNEDNLNPYWRKKAKQQYKQFTHEYDAKKKELDDLISALNATDNVDKEAIEKFEQKMKEKLPQFKFDDYGDDIEKEQFPYYVTIYNKSAVYEPAEGGYYVEVQYPAYSDGYSTYEDAKADLEDYVTSDTENWHKVDEDAYEWTGKYVGDGQYIRVETDKSYLKAIKTYSGYESFDRKRYKTPVRPRRLSESKEQTAKPRLNERMANKARSYGRR